MCSDSGAQPYDGGCPIQGWTAPEDANRRALSISRTAPPNNASIFTDQPQATSIPGPQSLSFPGYGEYPGAIDASSMNSFAPARRANEYGGLFTAPTVPTALGMPGSSGTWMDPHMPSADFASTSNLNHGLADYVSSGADMGRTGSTVIPMQPSMRADYGQTIDDFGIRHGMPHDSDQLFDTFTGPGWAPANVRRSLSYGHGDPPPFRPIPSMYQPHAGGDLLPRSSTAPPTDVRPSGGPMSGGPVGERCRWGGQCQTIITDLTASGINRHLKECHVQPWDDRMRGYCEWEGSPCNKKLQFYFGFGKHIASVHIRSTASKCEMCGQILARGDTLDRHAKRFCHGRPPG
ncbi:uncharacterized protein B0H18DRAFT_331103 [Fomitopsis serialis]|uniref:uncharacterized protein n=1 Tax=Fomitopsis serialis TaxID=139415 RepID=UPI002007452D|nr:uncharacterized protein B0H18DRAFT_331103 [Neoantrodia serialis]KAH9926728.1 hypothetical protein B0H18DRAFT_331103 [Neoantrodia serialis]